jgi:hypothetical protein
MDTQNGPSISILEKNRVVRPEIEDGKTEWFLVSARELSVGI